MSLNLNTKFSLKIISILIMGMFAYLYIFLPYPSNYIFTDPDSAYIFSSLSSIMRNPVWHVDHPGLTLHILGRIPIFIGSLFAKGDGLIEKVILNLSFYQKLFLLLIWCIYLVAFIVYLNTVYKKEDGLKSIVCGLAAFGVIMPPTLGESLGVNADFGAFLFGILFATSLLWEERNFKTDLLTSLFYALMVYCKVIYAPLILLVFVVRKYTYLRIILFTFLWMITIYILFWNPLELQQHWDTLRGYASSKQSYSIGTLLKFHVKYFLEYPLQNIYILLFLFFSALLIFKNEYRVKGIVLFVAMIVSFEISILRPYNASVYTWTLFVVGLLLVNYTLKLHANHTKAIICLFSILFLISNITIMKDVFRRRTEGLRKVEYKKNYKSLIIKSNVKNLFEYQIIPWQYYALGSNFFLGNGYSEHKYTPKLMEYIKKDYGIENYKYYSTWKHPDPPVYDYFPNEKGENTFKGFVEPYILLIHESNENNFRKKFPGIKMSLIGNIADTQMHLWRID